MADNNRRFGDRQEGRQLRSLSAYAKLAPFLIRTRSEAAVCFVRRAEVTTLDRFVRDRRFEGMDKLTDRHVYISAYIRTLRHFPAMNRFIAGGRIYSRYSIDIALPAADDQTPLKYSFQPSDTLSDVMRKIADRPSAGTYGAVDGPFDRFTASMIKIPAPVLKFTVWFLKLCDFFGLLPQTLLSQSPFHGSAAIDWQDGQPVRHNLRSFGNIPIALSIGKARADIRLNDQSGALETGLFADYTLTLDSRICPDFNPSDALNYFDYCLQNPDTLLSALD